MNPTAKWLTRLETLKPCEDGLAWARGYKSVQAAWDACERPDWMIWYLGELDADRKLLVIIACDCAATALPIWKKHYPNDNRPAEAIRTARAWVRGKATMDKIYAAAVAADAAAAANAAANAAYAAYAAADAGDVAYAAARAYAYADRTKANQRMARLIRKRVPVPEKGLKP